ncbi:AAA family ATPase [Streptomyces sp. NPDC058622]|uniref:AAA family ATPase n=1 Tax=Streptomyces sp. NPDC058622 TaxID=3346562 RepID=UPI003666813B
MTDGLTGSGIIRRHFVAVATSEYGDLGFEPLDVEGEVSALHDWLCAEGLGERRFVQQHRHLADNPDEDAIRAALRNPPPGERWRASDAAVVFVTGHGIVADGRHWMVLRETETDRLQATALRTADLVAWLATTDIQHLLLILDLCYAGRAAAEVTSFDREIPRTWLVLPSATKSQEAVTGALTSAISGFLQELASAEGQKYGLAPFLDVASFLQAVESRLGTGQRLIPLAGSQQSGAHPCLPNPHYRVDTREILAPQRGDLALSQQDMPAHWEPRSRGVARAEEAGWLFTGRAALMRRLIEVATSDVGALIVAGRAGSGKSAALARLVTLSDPAFIGRFREQVDAIPDDLKPPVGSIAAAILATGKTGHEILGQLCHVLDVPLPGAETAQASMEELLAAWQSWLSGQGQPVTIVIDALDEASDPPRVLSDVLARLDVNNAHRGVRLLLGVRSHGGTGGKNEEAGTATAPSLAEAAARLLGGERVQVDEAPWWQQQEVAQYTTRILRSVPGTPYTDTQAAAAVGQILAANCGKSFLVARIAATSLAHRPRCVDLEDRSWLTAVLEGVVGVFREDLHLTLPDPATRERAVHLLRALAFSFGRGLPWLEIWPLVANAVAGELDRYGDSDIAWLLDTRLAAYLVADREDGQTVYRLFHDALRATLRERWRDLLGENADDRVG